MKVDPFTVSVEEKSRPAGHQQRRHEAGAAFVHSSLSFVKERSSSPRAGSLISQTRVGNFRGSTSPCGQASAALKTVTVSARAPSLEYVGESTGGRVVKRAKKPNETRRPSSSGAKDL